MEVILTKDELEFAYNIGSRRHIESILKKLQNKHGASPERSLDIHVAGALGELAFAKALDKFYIGHVNTFSKPDVGKYQIRYTKMKPPQLIIRKTDNNNEVFVSVSGEDDTFYINGWLKGIDGKQDKYIRNPYNRGEAYFIPVEDLYTMETLP